MAMDFSIKSKAVASSAKTSRSLREINDYYGDGGEGNGGLNLLTSRPSFTTRVNERDKPGRCRDPHENRDHDYHYQPSSRDSSYRYDDSYDDTQFGSSQGGRGRSRASQYYAGREDTKSYYGSVERHNSSESSAPSLVCSNTSNSFKNSCGSDHWNNKNHTTGANCAASRDARITEEVKLEGWLSHFKPISAVARLPSEVQSFCEEETHLSSSTAATIEVSPGEYLRLRGADETWRAIQCDFYMPCECICCSLTILCIQDADFVLCPGCQVVSPMEGAHEGRDGGVGLGFTMEDLARWLEEIS